MSEYQSKALKQGKPKHLFAYKPFYGAFPTDISLLHEQKYLYDLFCCEGRVQSVESGNGALKLIEGIKKSVRAFSFVNFSS